MHLGFNLLFLIPGETGGRETYSRRLIEALYVLRPGLQATAFVNRDMGGPERRALGATMRVVRLPVSARRPDSWAIGELVRMPGAATRAGVDLLHSMANFGPGNGRFRRIQTLHDLQFRAVPELMSGPRRRATGMLLGYAARHADRIITGSAAAAHDLSALPGIDAQRIAVTPYGVSPAPEVSSDAVTALRERLRLGARPAALTVATNLPHKNLPLVMTLLAAIAPEQRPVVIFAGHGTDDPQLRAAADTAGVSQDVRLLGGVEQSQLEALYALSACLLLPTRYEGFGLPALEAMIRGVPVVCTDIPPLREITGDAALRFPVDRPADGAAALTRVLSESGLAEHLVAEGRRRAAGYRWSTTAEATLDVYAEALAER